MKCFYHNADLDGICSGAIVKRRYPKCEMFGIDYTDEFPWKKIKKGEIVLMVDFSLQPLDEMVKLNEQNKLIWIDHHESKIADEPKLGVKIDGVRMVGKAGCELTWEFCQLEEVPLAVTLLGRYDVFDLDYDQRVLPFQYGARALGLTVESMGTWENLFRREQGIRFGTIVKDGVAILKFLKVDNKMYAQKHAFHLDFEGYRAAVINRGGANSQLFDSVFDPAIEDLMIAFVLKRDKWTVSLYSEKDGPDVSKIAKKHGGGGHAHAAGFVCEKLPFSIPHGNPKSKGE